MYLFQEKYLFKINKLNPISYKKILDQFEWMICKEFIWFEANLQWTIWSKTFWFYWLINWMKQKASWPNCKSDIIKDGVKLNKEIKNYLDTWISLWDTNEIEWNIHHKSWEIYWQEWEDGVWVKWMFDKLHIDHKLDLMDDIFNEVSQKAKCYEETYESIKSDIKREVEKIESK